MMIIETVLIFVTGALGYGGLEMLWRGRTHWTMLLLGGICFLAVYLITTRLTALPLPIRWLLCSIVITLLEFFCGCIVNLRLDWKVWDYSDEPGNLLGQVCPLFAAAWFLLSIPCSALAAALKKYLFSQDPTAR